jgi:uncharacterized RDD family membrane protein YckC
MAESEKTLEYPKAPRWKRTFAFLFDFLCALILTLCLSAGGNAILSSSAPYQEAQETMKSIELSSGLYVDVKGTSTRLSDYYTSLDSANSVSLTESDYQSRDEHYDEVLTAFYGNSLFFSGEEGKTSYAELKVGDSITLNGSAYFEYQNVSGTATIVKKDGITYAQLAGFYKECLDQYAIPQISAKSASYLEASRRIFWSIFLLIYLLAVFSIFIFYAVVPLFFRRGYQTFGKKLLRLSLVNAHAINPSAKQYWARTLLLVFVEFVLSSASFLVPSFVSFTMLMLRKDGQSFHDYVAGTYVVDTSDQLIYLSEEEYFEREQKLENMTLKDTTNLDER